MGVQHATPQGSGLAMEIPSYARTCVVVHPSVGGEEREESKHSFGTPSFQELAGLFDLGRETFLIWKSQFIFARQNLVR